MTYSVTAYDAEGARLATLGMFGNIESARQAMLDHSETVDLPAEAPWFGPHIGVMEGWFIDRTEYLIEVVR